MAPKKNASGIISGAHRDVSYIPMASAHTVREASVGGRARIDSPSYIVYIYYSQFISRSRLAVIPPEEDLHRTPHAARAPLSLVQNRKYIINEWKARFFFVTYAFQIYTVSDSIIIIFFRDGKKIVKNIHYAKIMKMHIIALCGKPKSHSIERTSVYVCVCVRGENLSSRGVVEALCGQKEASEFRSLREEKK